MLRLMQNKEIEELSDLWLESSLIAHDFVPAKFWQDRLPLIKSDYLSKSITYVYEERGEALGFLSLVKEQEVGGLFVATKAQGQGVGYALMEQAKLLFDVLELYVYACNEKAVTFYMRQGFTAVAFYKGKDTGEESIRMRWRK